MENLLKHASSKHGPVSLWVNNAGVEVETSYKPFGKKVQSSPPLLPFSEASPYMLNFHRMGSPPPPSPLPSPIPSRPSPPFNIPPSYARRQSLGRSWIL
jgi:hypothetical protein